jgi:hypothetical protein
MKEVRDTISQMTSRDAATAEANAARKAAVKTAVVEKNAKTSLVILQAAFAQASSEHEAAKIASVKKVQQWSAASKSEETLRKKLEDAEKKRKAVEEILAEKDEALKATVAANVEEAQSQKMEADRKVQAATADTVQAQEEGAVAIAGVVGATGAAGAAGAAGAGDGSAGAGAAGVGAASAEGAAGVQGQAGNQQ